MQKNSIKFIDLFAGIGGIRLGFESANCECIWSNDNDKFCAETYLANFPDSNFILEDIRNIKSKEIPDFDIVCAGFPCQPFSQAGISMRKSLNRPHGFADKTRGTLFYEIARIIYEKKPAAFFLENVKNLERHDKGRTFRTIKETMLELGYSFYYKILNANLLVPQNRERVYLIGFKDKDIGFIFPKIINKKPKIKDILEKKVDEKYTLTNHQWNYQQKRAEIQKRKGHGFGYGLVDLESYSRTLSARYHKDGSEIFIPQKNKNPRKLTPRECARLQGFPDSFKIPVSNTQAYKQFGNSIAVPIIEELAKSIVFALKEKPRSKIEHTVQSKLDYFNDH